MDDDLPIFLPVNSGSIPQFDTEKMYAGFGPDSTQLVRNSVETPDAGRMVRTMTSQRDHCSPPIEEYEVPVRSGNTTHKLSGKLSLERGLY